MYEAYKQKGYKTNRTKVIDALNNLKATITSTRTIISHDRRNTNIVKTKNKQRRTNTKAYTYQDVRIQRHVQCIKISKNKYAYKADMDQLGQVMRIGTANQGKLLPDKNVMLAVRFM